MPSSITHYLLAKELLKKFEEEHAPLPVLSAFLCGAQGPDFLFIHKSFPWQKGESLRPIGQIIHWKKPSLFFEAMRIWLKHHADASFARSYALGFLSHYALDRCAHPYVYSQVRTWTAAEPDKAVTPSDAHIQIETALDIIMLRYLWAQTPMELPLKRVFPRLHKGEPEIVNMLSASVLQAFGKAIPSDGFCEAMRDFRLSQRLATDRTLLKKPLIERFDRRRKNPDFYFSSYLHAVSEGDSDFANVLHEEWENPYEECPRVHTEDFFALYHQAFALSQKLMEGFIDSLSDERVDLSVLTGERSYETGLPVKDSDSLSR